MQIVVRNFYICTHGKRFQLQAYVLEIKLTTVAPVVVLCDTIDATRYCDTKVVALTSKFSNIARQLMIYSHRFESNLLHRISNKMHLTIKRYPIAVLCRSFIMCTLEVLILKVYRDTLTMVS